MFAESGDVHPYAAFETKEGVVVVDLVAGPNAGLRHAAVVLSDYNRQYVVPPIASSSYAPGYNTSLLAGLSVERGHSVDKGPMIAIALDRVAEEGNMARMPNPTSLAAVSPPLNSSLDITYSLDLERTLTGVQLQETYDALSDYLAFNDNSFSALLARSETQNSPTPQQMNPAPTFSLAMPVKQSISAIV